MILDSAIGLRKKVQDFDLKSFSMGAEHSQTVKADPIGSDFRSKDCAFGPDPIAESRMIITDPSQLQGLDKDKFFMKEALKEAKKAFDLDEVPVGSVLVHQDKIIARGHNQVELLQDATAHAEMLCLTAGASQVENWRLVDMTLYCTLEPCAMCAGAMFSSRISRLVWACPDLRVGANGSWIDLFSFKHPIHTIEVLGGVLQEEAADLMRKFFQKVRKK